MPYAQINYQEYVGNSKLTLSEIGCFVTADANLLEKIGVTADPEALNRFYTEHNLYSYDLTDRANDDITWSTVSKYYPHLVVKQIGGAGWPDSDLAQVEFRYTDHRGGTVTHFCAVNHVADRSIIDSWDGKVKTPAEYEHVYGQPVAWATFVNNTPAPHPAPAPAHTVTNPVYVTVQPGWGLNAVADAAGFKDAALPSRWVAIAKLNGSDNWQDFNAHLQPGQRVLVSNGGHGAGESTVSGTPQTGGIPVNEVIPAPTTVTQAQPSASVASTEIPSAPSVAYERLKDADNNPTTYSLVTKAGAQKVNFMTGKVVEELAAGQPFVAYGKAVFPDNTTYYMNENDFGIADERGDTPLPQGIKTTSLEYPPKPVEAPQAPAQPASPADETPKYIETALPWQKSFVFFPNKEVIRYVVKEDMQVYSFVSGNDIQPVPAGTPVSCVGTFIYGGKRYYLPMSSASPELKQPEWKMSGNNTWYGFPVASLRRQDARSAPMDSPEDHDITQLGNEAASLSKIKHPDAIKRVASADGLLSRFKLKRSK